MPRPALRIVDIVYYVILWNNVFCIVICSFLKGILHHGAVAIEASSFWRARPPVMHESCSLFTEKIFTVLQELYMQTVFSVLSWKVLHIVGSLNLSISGCFVFQ